MEGGGRRLLVLMENITLPCEEPMKANSMDLPVRLDPLTNREIKSATVNCSDIEV